MSKIIRTSSAELELKSSPLIMGIINVTPDSFSDGGKYLSFEKAVERGKTLIDQGADILDIGGESTRPGSEGVGEDEEISRVVPVIKELSEFSDVPISIDTTKSSVAEKALDAGAQIINDISGLTFDRDMKYLAAESGAAVIIMHILGRPKTMQKDIKYDSLLDDIAGFLTVNAQAAVEAGVDSCSIIIDPGIGFGKTVEQNLEIIRNVSFFRKIGYPVLIGASKKSFIGEVLDLEVDERLEGTLAVDSYLTMQGIDIIRTHEVRATRRAVNMSAALAR